MAASSSHSYDLVHIITGGEYKTPLLATQVFDRAQVQAITPGPNKPASVSVWIMEPMRELFDKKSMDIVRRHRKRCPNIHIKMIGGISRLNKWPAEPMLKKLRSSLKHNTVYHCRGESTFEWAALLKKRFPKDAIVLDIRGYRPLERFAGEDIYDEKDMSPAQKELSRNDVQVLKNVIDRSDMVCTVSAPLRQYIIDHVNAQEDTVLIPCCVTNTVPDTHREATRQQLNLGNKTAILYLGGTQKYQHLEDLVIPFIKSATDQSDDVVGVFLTQNKEKMLALIHKFGVNEERIRLISAPQAQVSTYLTAMDMGLLLRAPTALNNFSQPVKFGEYLSAGLPVILEAGTGNIAEMLDKYGMGYVVTLTGKTEKAAFDQEVGMALKWERQNRGKVRTNTRTFVEQNYTWNANQEKERDMYVRALEKANLKTTTF